jgi:hypothetical protein
VGDFFLQHRGIWYTLGQIRVNLPEWKHICVALDTAAEMALAAVDGKVRMCRCIIGLNHFVGQYDRVKSF